MTFQEQVWTLLRRRPMTQREVADELGLEYGTVNSTFRALRRKGCIELDHAEGREVYYKATTRSPKTIASAIPAVPAKGRPYKDGGSLDGYGFRKCLLEECWR